MNFTDDKMNFLIKGIKSLVRIELGIQGQGQSDPRAYALNTTLS
jgi:hypothetical protein